MIFSYWLNWYILVYTLPITYSPLHTQWDLLFSPSTSFCHSTHWTFFLSMYLSYLVFCRHFFCGKGSFGSLGFFLFTYFLKKHIFQIDWTSSYYLTTPVCKEEGWKEAGQVMRNKLGVGIWARERERGGAGGRMSDRENSYSILCANLINT